MQGQGPVTVVVRNSRDLTRYVAECAGPVECLQTRSLDAYMVCWRFFSLETLNVEFLQLSR